MKFVKGDAIAGLIIVAVNLLGGLVIGIMQRGMTAGEAVKAYSILTIGDGLVSQIPALFISICAGIIVTRVTSDDGGPSNVGKDIGTQLLPQPQGVHDRHGRDGGLRPDSRHADRDLPAAGGRRRHHRLHHDAR